MAVTINATTTPSASEPRRRHENWATALEIDAGTTAGLTRRDSPGHDHDPNRVLTNLEASAEPRPPVNLIDASHQPD
jgi:hypothetical protein